jgi:hypothetical protein
MLLNVDQKLIDKDSDMAMLEIYNCLSFVMSSFLEPRTIMD